MCSVSTDMCCNKIKSMKLILKDHCQNFSSNSSCLDITHKLQKLTYYSKKPILKVSFLIKKHVRKHVPIHGGVLLTIAEIEFVSIISALPTDSCKSFFVVMF